MDESECILVDKPPTVGMDEPCEYWLISHLPTGAGCCPPRVVRVLAAVKKGGLLKGGQVHFMAFFGGTGRCVPVFVWVSSLVRGGGFAWICVSKRFSIALGDYHPGKQSSFTTVGFLLIGSFG